MIIILDNGGADIFGKVLILCAIFAIVGSLFDFNPEQKKQQLTKVMEQQLLNQVIEEIPPQPCLVSFSETERHMREDFFKKNPMASAQDWHNEANRLMNGESPYTLNFVKHGIRKYAPKTRSRPKCYDLEQQRLKRYQALHQRTLARVQ